MIKRVNLFSGKRQGIEDMSGAELIQGKYKIECTLRASEDYVAYRAVDIEDREKKSVILNVYSGQYVKEFVKVFHDLGNCGDYKGMFLYDGKIASIFKWNTGENFSQIFKKKADLSIEYRMKSGDQLFHIGLLVDSYPEEIRRSVLCDDNFRVKQASEEIVLNFLISPDKKHVSVAKVIESKVRTVFPRGFTVPIVQREFFLSLEEKPPEDGKELFERWREYKEPIADAWKKSMKRGSIERFFEIIFMNIKWFFKYYFRKWRRKR